MDIPDEIFNLFNTGVNAMLESKLAVTAILVFPPLQTECPNCIVNPFGGGSSGKYKSGGLYVFTDGQVCPYCQGIGFIETSSETIIKLLVDWNPKIYNNVIKASVEDNKQFKVPYENIKVQGYIADLVNFRQAKEIKLHSTVTDFGYWNYVIDGAPLPYDLGHNSYFGCLMKRVS